MATRKSSTKKASSRGRAKSAKSSALASSQLMKLFEDELKDIYWAEKALTKAIPKMIKNATSKELTKALTKHLGETRKQVTRAERVFKAIGKKAIAKKCEAMSGLIKEAEEKMKDSQSGPMRDAAIISAGQKVEHYEIASYGTLHQFAVTLGLDDASMLLQATLNEEKAADDKLTEVAVSAVNVQASHKREKK